MLYDNIPLEKVVECQMETSGLAGVAMLHSSVTLGFQHATKAWRGSLHSPCAEGLDQQSYLNFISSVIKP